MLACIQDATIALQPSAQHSYRFIARHLCMSGLFSNIRNHTDIGVMTCQGFSFCQHISPFCDITHYGFLA